VSDPVRIPGLLDISIEPPFVRSQQVEDLAAEVIAAFDEFEPIQTAQRECGLSIEYVWETKPFDPARDEYHAHVVAKVTKASPLWLSLTDTHLVVQFRRWFWERFDDSQRRAVLHHELTHVEVDEPDDQGRIPVRLRKHDVEDFTQTMRRFGPVIPGRRAFIAAATEWGREHPGALGEGTAAHEDAFGHQVAEEVARRINAGEMDTADATATATVSHSPMVVDAETGEILSRGDDPDEVLHRIERRPDHLAVLGSDEGQEALRGAARKAAESRRRAVEP
jgi:hypothetical protein